MKHMAYADVFSTTYELLTMKHMRFTVKHMGSLSPEIEQTLSCERFTRNARAGSSPLYGNGFMVYGYGLKPYGFGLGFPPLKFFLNPAQFTPVRVLDHKTLVPDCSPV